MRMRVGISVRAGWMIATSPAWASTTVPMSLDQLTQASSDIVQAYVQSQVSEWNATHTLIVTVTTLAVSRVFKGNASSMVEIDQVGGTVGNRRMFVPGDITFQPQQAYILFLEPVPASSHYQVVGMTQGAYPVYQDSTTHQERVILPMSRQLEMKNQSVAAENPTGTFPVTGFHQYVANIVEAGIQIPHGLSMSVAILSTQSRGTGHLHIYAKTRTDMFPNKSLVIPAGTEVEGEAVLTNSIWTINWDELNVRGVHAQISAINRESEGSLRGRSLVIQVR